MVSTAMPRDENGQPIPALYPLASQKVAYTDTSARSAAFSANVKVVELTPTTDCYIVFGDSAVVAVTTDIFLQSGVVYTYAVGGNSYIAAIRSAVSGTLHVTELQ